MIRILGGGVGKGYVRGLVRECQGGKGRCNTVFSYYPIEMRNVKLGLISFLTNPVSVVKFRSPWLGFLPR